MILERGWSCPVTSELDTARMARNRGSVNDEWVMVEVKRIGTWKYSDF